MVDPGAVVPNFSTKPPSWMPKTYLPRDHFGKASSCKAKAKTRNASLA